MPMVVPVLNRLVNLNTSHGTIARTTSDRFYTNYILRSVDQGNATWTISGVTRAKDAVDPEGIASSATTLTEDSAVGAGHNIVQNVALAANTTVTYSCFVKRGAGTRHVSLLLLGSGGTNYLRKGYDLTNFALGTTTTVGNALFLNASISAYPNSWYRLSLTGKYSTTVVLSSLRIEIASNSANTVTYNGDGASQIIVWGAQLETGYIPTTLISTTTVAVTREEP